MNLAPRIEGSVPVQSSAAQFVQAFRRRVTAGLLTGQPHPRSDYQVVDAGGESLRVRAASYWTAISVGLNDIELRISQAGTVHYRVEYWRWASYCLGLSGVLGLAGLLLLLTVDLREFVADFVTFGLPGLSIEQNVGIVWAMVLFWGFAWPWCLILIHKGPLRRLVERIIREVDAQAVKP